LGGKVEGITAEEAFSLTAQDFDNLSQAQLNALAQNQEARLALQPQVFSESARIKSAFQAINPEGKPIIGQAIAQELNDPITGAIARRQTAAKFPGAQFLFRPSTNTGLFNAEGGPILASERLNAGGPVQYFNEGQSVNAAPDYPGEEPGPPGSAVDYSGPVSSAMSVGQAADQSNEGKTSAVDAAIDYGKSTAKSLGISALTTPFGPLGYAITAPLAMNSFVKGLTDEEGTQAVDFAQKAGQVAQQLGLSLSKNQAYPGDYGYGLDPDTDFSNQTAFSPTISRYSSDFDVDDPLQGGQ